MRNNTTEEVKTLWVFSGLPGAGKDFCANALVRQYGAHKLQAKDPLWAVARSMLHEEHGSIEGEAHYLACINSAAGGYKDTEPVWHGKTWRQLLIWLSEDVLKVAFGQDIMGLRLHNRVVLKLFTSESMHIVVPDCGFPAELVALSAIPRNVRKIFCPVIRAGAEVDVYDSRAANLHTLRKQAERLGWEIHPLINIYDGTEDSGRPLIQELQKLADASGLQREAGVEL